MKDESKVTLGRLLRTGEFSKRCEDCDRKFSIVVKASGNGYVTVSNGVEIEYCPYCRPDTEPWKFGRNAFTLMECMVVVVIIGVLCGAAIPLYQKTIEHAIDRRLREDVRFILAAATIYKIRNANKKFVQMGESDIFLPEINKRLEINLPPADGKAKYWAVNMNGTLIVAAGYGIKWSLGITDLDGDKIRCLSGQCPGD